MHTRRMAALILGAAFLAWTILPAADRSAAWASGSAPAASASGGASHGGADNTNPLQSLKGDLAVFSGVIFLLLVAILGKFAWGPICRGLDQREKKMSDEVAAAEKANADARDLLDEYRKKLEASQGEVREILDLARRDAEQSTREILEKARVEADSEKQRALREIETAKDGALEELSGRLASSAVDLAGKILQTRLDPNSHAKLIEQAVSDFTKVKPSKN